MSAETLRVHVVHSPRFAEGPRYAGAIVRAFERLAEDRERTTSAICTRVRCTEEDTGDGGSQRVVRRPRPIDWDTAAVHVVIVLSEGNLVADANGDWGPFFRDIEAHRKAEVAPVLAIVVPVNSTGNTLPFFADRQLVEQGTFREHGTELKAHADGEPPLPNAPMRKLLLLLLSATGAFLRSTLGATVPHLPGFAKGTGPIRLFISHSSAGGQTFSQAVHARAGKLNPQWAEPFLDSRDLRATEEYDPKFESTIQSGAFLAIHTDDYASRAYCRWETLLAKQARSPILIAHLLTLGEARAFAYSGNVPTRVILARAVPSPEEDEDDLRIANQAREIDLLLLALLSETLRMLVFTYDVARAALATKRPVPEVLGRPTEVSDVAHLLKRKAELVERGVDLVYPDPPLDAKEVEIVDAVAAPLRVLTLSEFRAGDRSAPRGVGVPDRRPLKTALIGVSVGDPSGDREPTRLGHHVDARGMWTIHQALAQAVTVVTELGGRVGYGGDLRPGGFTHALFRETADARHVFSLGTVAGLFDHYLAWSAWRRERDGKPTVSPEDLLGHVARLRFVGQVRLFLPDGAALRLVWEERGTEDRVLAIPEGDAATPFAGTYGLAGLERLYAAVPGDGVDEGAALSAMRERMAKDERARVVFGGKTSGHSGAFPGVMEEAIRTITREKLLLVCGAFGGAAHDVGVALGLIEEPLWTRTAADRGTGYDNAMHRLRALRPHYLADLERRGIGRATWTALARSDNPAVLAEHLRVALRTVGA